MLRVWGKCAHRCALGNDLVTRVRILAPAGRQNVSENVTAAEPPACATPDWDRPILPNQIMGGYSLASLACSESLVQGLTRELSLSGWGSVSGGGSVDWEDRGWPSISHLLALACQWPTVGGRGSQHRQSMPGLPGRDLHSAGEAGREAK